MQKEKGPEFIVTIGASAGGLSAVSELVAQFPEELDIAVFVVIHLSGVKLGEILISRLQKYTPFTCVMATDGEVIEAKHIYIAPPDKHFLIKDGKIAFGYGPPENRWRPSIDVLFRSAAATYGNRVIGTILTGYHNDGVAGMSAIKQNNGYCIVQDPKQAEYPDMPQSILDTVQVDYCLPLNKIAETVETIIKEASPEKIATNKEIFKEAEIAQETLTDIETVAGLGEKSLFVCPDCGGGLWSIDRNNIKRYRCHVGHAFTEKDLVIKQGESFEATMWIALRIMEERKMLFLKISADEKNKGFSRLAETHLQKAKELEEHIKKLKELLFSTKKEKVV